jgi:Fe2+ transport system protein B
MKLKQIIKAAGKRLERASDRIETHHERKKSRKILETINTQLNNLNTAEKLTEINAKITDLRTKVAQLDNNTTNLPLYSTINTCLTIIDQFIISMTQEQASITTASSTIDRLRGEISNIPKTHQDSDDISADCANMLQEMQTAQTTFNSNCDKFMSYYHATIAQFTAIQVLMEQLTTNVAAAASPIVTAFRQQQEHTKEALPAAPESGLHLVLRMQPRL